MINSQAGASTAPVGTTDVNITEVGGDAFNLGQKDAAASISVTPCNDVPFPVTQGAGGTGSWAVKQGTDGGSATYTSVSASGGGTISSGALSVSIVSNSTYSGNVNGVAFPAGAAATISAPLGKTLPAILYTVSAGLLRIDVIS